MWIEMLARRDGREVRDVIDQVFLNVATVFLAEERGRGSSLRSKGRDGLDEFILQSVQVVGWLDDDPGETVRRRRDVVILGFSNPLPVSLASRVLLRVQAR